MMNPFSLANKTVLVTGASSGIGRATAKWCAAMGAKVCLNGRNVDALQAVMEELDGSGHILYPADLIQEEQLLQLVKSLPILDGVAFCAGIAKMLPFAFVNQMEMDRLFRTNFFAPVQLAQRLLKSKKLNKGASLVYVSSVDGPKVAQAGNSIYASSKSALTAMVHNMAIELAGKKIRVNSVLPGTTDTPMIRTDNVTEEALIERAKVYPLRRLGTPDDIAFAIIYLLSDASGWVTGSDLVVDGGFSLQ